VSRQAGSVDESGIKTPAVAVIEKSRAARKEDAGVE
jgi:hypothetical protein